MFSPLSLKGKIPLPSRTEKELGYFKLTSFRLFKVFAFLWVFHFSISKTIKSDNLFTFVAVSSPFIEGDNDTIFS